MAYRKCNISNWILSFTIVLLTNGSREHCSCAAFEAYFPTTAVRFNLPINEQAESIFSKMPLGRFQVLAAANNSRALDYIYSLEENTLLSINSTSGEVFMRTNYKPIHEASKYMLTALPRSQPDTGKVLHLTLEITPVTPKDYCANLSNICFWSSAHYTTAEHATSIGGPGGGDGDTFQATEIGALSSRASRYLCPVLDIKYSLGTASEYFELHGNQLYTRVPLDHEAELQLPNQLDNVLKVRIRCTLKLNSDDETHVYERTVNVTLLDRNDNGPELQEAKQRYDFQLAEPYFKANDAIGDKIIFVDKDAMATNAHMNYIIENDVNDLVRPICNAYETDHTGRPHTVISCQLIFARNGLLSQPRYCFKLEASDKTADVRSSVKRNKAEICLHTNVNEIHETDHPVALELRQQRKNPRIINTVESTLNGQDGGALAQSLPVAYEKDIYVYRTAQPYNRVAQPDNYHDLLETRSTPRFGIVEDRSGAFGITSVAGIVYVKNAAALENAPETVYFLNITWQDTRLHSFVMNIHLTNGRPENASCELKLKSRTQSCAQIKYQKQCVKFCGLATNGGACSWRGSNAGLFGRNYASCVPAPKYCPDNVCDPLEDLNTYACPQDCTSANRIVGPHTSNDNRRGILSASGTCICEDNNKCSCAPLDDDEPRPKRKRKNETSTEKVSVLGAVPPVSAKASASGSTTPGEAEQQSLNVAGFTCGKSCLLIAISTPVALVVLLICLLISRRNLRRRTLGKESSSTVKKCGAPPDAECDVRNGDLPLMQLDNGFKFDTSDSKWEFEREKLKLDVVLGEGEFGKVVKAHATEIAGLRGVTTVAVKMLKKGANSVEYMALLSEFQLLQEVSHPNVIKLLGACTKGSESPMIIIEYARYGSLRGYLRLSRKIECAGVDFTDGVEPVTAKNILTFAWQICKGMAYLTEIKLVHRDLAARNVLLADGKICKISDFGLTRDVYEDDAYLKRSRDRVPVKWMAPESLADHVYTTKSDVWAFGVLCWELITLGASPYPGIPPQNLYHLLKTGYRMERPENCSEEVYSIVRSCWTDEPNARPSFKYLASQFEKLLGNNAKYIELEANAFSNPLYCSDEAALMPNGDTDYNATITDDLGDPDVLEHLWCPPKIAYDTQDCSNSCEQSTTFGSGFQPPPGYDMPRPLIETATTEQVLRYENDLRFPLNIRKSIAVPSYSNMNGAAAANDMPHYSVPVKRGRSYVDMTNNSLIPDNLDNRDFDKHLSKTISFKFSSLLNLKEQEHEHEQDQAMV